MFRPGVYEYVPGMTLGGLVGRAEGLLPTAYRPVARVIPRNSSAWRPWEIRPTASG